MLSYSTNTALYVTALGRDRSAIYSNTWFLFFFIFVGVFMCIFFRRGAFIFLVGGGGVGELLVTGKHYFPLSIVLWLGLIVLFLMKSIDHFFLFGK